MVARYALRVAPDLGSCPLSASITGLLALVIAALVVVMGFFG